MHWQGTPHHHHHDVGHHSDYSKDSVRHFLLDGTVGSLALMTPVTLPILLVAAEPPRVDPGLERPAPYLDRSGARREAWPETRAVNARCGPVIRHGRLGRRGSAPSVVPARLPCAAMPSLRTDHPCLTFRTPSRGLVTRVRRFLPTRPPPFLRPHP